MASLRVPGLGGFLAAREQGDQEQARELQTAASVLSLRDVLAKSGKEQAFRADLEALGANPSQEALATVASKYAAPDALLRTQQSSLDRQAAAENTKAMREATIAQQKYSADLMHEYRMKTATTGEERAAELARHNKVMEGLSLQIAQLRADANKASRSPFYTFMSTPDGIVAGDARAGTLSRPTLDGRPVMKATDDPAHQGAVAGARETGKAVAGRQFNMEGIGAVIKRAEDVLEGRDPNSGEKRPLPTQSGIGTLYDKAAGFVGMSPEGSVEAQDLKAIAGALTAKMPRMEGPQSDRDTQLYREAAAEVGDSNVPIAQRRRALDTVKMLWQKYESQNPDAFQAQGGGGAAGGWSIRPLP